MLRSEGNAIKLVLFLRLVNEAVWQCPAHLRSLRSGVCAHVLTLYSAYIYVTAAVDTLLQCDRRTYTAVATEPALLLLTQVDYIFSHGDSYNAAVCELSPDAAATEVRIIICTLLFPFPACLVSKCGRRARC